MVDLSADDRLELRALKAATAALAEDVQNLTGALEQNYATKQTVASVKRVVETTAQNQAADRATRRRIVNRFVGFAVLLLAIFTAISLGLVNYADQQSRVAEQSRVAAFNACEARNNQVVKLRNFLTNLAKVEAGDPTADPATKRARIKAFTEFSTDYTPVPCEALR